MTEPYPLSYFTADELARFPKLGVALAETAVELNDTLFVATGGVILTTVPRYIVNIVDKPIEATDAQKEALIIGALYTFAPYALEKASRAGYSAETMSVLKEVANYDEVPPAAESNARVMLTAVTSVILALSPFMEGGNPVPAELALNLQYSMQRVEDHFLPNLNAPKLAALYTQAKQEFFDLATNKPATPQPKPPKRSGLRC